jgi:hypothetical protein
MAAGWGLRAALVGGLALAAIGAVTIPADATVPGAAVKMRAAMVQERRALHALPPAAAGRGSYARSLAHANAAVSDLLAVQAAFATAARETGSFPHIVTMQRLLDSAIAGSSDAAEGLSHAIWLIDHGAPAGSTVAALARSDLRQALAASTSLAKLLA